MRLWNLISMLEGKQAEICQPQTIRSPIEALYAHSDLFLCSAHDSITAKQLPHLTTSTPFTYVMQGRISHQESWPQISRQSLCKYIIDKPVFQSCSQQWSVEADKIGRRHAEEPVESLLSESVRVELTCAFFGGFLQDCKQGRGCFVQVVGVSGHFRICSMRNLMPRFSQRCINLPHLTLSISCLVIYISRCESRQKIYLRESCWNQSCLISFPTLESPNGVTYA